MCKDGLSSKNFNGFQQPLDCLTVGKFGDFKLTSEKE